MCETQFLDINKDFVNQTIELKPDYEGRVVATLVYPKSNLHNRKSVLYIHGYVDYFFQAHLAKKLLDNEFDFYALDLRKYGRSLLPYQHPNYCRDLIEYYEEISIAIRQIHKQSNGEVFLMGHSTGGLIASNYMNDGLERHLIKGVILNSPFLDFNITQLQKKLLFCISSPIVQLFPYAKVNGVLSPAYAKSIHKDFYGEWNFSLDWKPIKGFPTYFKWILAIRKGHKKLENSNILVPILVMHSSSSSKTSKFSQKATCNDIVLNIEDIKRVGENLGKQVNLLEVENALHDIFLSSIQVREKSFIQILDWMNKK